LGVDDRLKMRRLTDRLARLNAADAWEQGLNPSQAEALLYLAQANRFSRQPSHVADYLASTRGTVSQTLKALHRKGLVDEERSDTDKRKLRYDLTQKGQEIATAIAGRSHSGEGAPELEALLRRALAARGMRTFGECKTCLHHDNGYCRLLELALTPPEAEQLCHEHRAA